jgi:ABC-2 type transport system ATP-binding protein/lipopolysaccharide transport system ATP-binding protein
LKKFTSRIPIIVLSSHSEALISSMCTRAILIEHGRIIRSGPTRAVLDEYRLMRGRSTPSNL